MRYCFTNYERWDKQSLIIIHHDCELENDFVKQPVHEILHTAMQERLNKKYERFPMGPSINYVRTYTRGGGGGQASHTLLLRTTCKKGDRGSK